MLGKEPGRFDALHLLGVIKLAQREHAEAEKWFGEALRSNPDSESANNNRGSALLALGRPLDALDAFGKAAAIRPDSADARVNQAAALLAMGRHADAIARYDEALARQPDYLLAHFGRAYADQQLGSHDAAIAGFARVLEMQPDHFDALCALARSLKAQGRLEDTVAAISRALAVRPGNEPLLSERANVLNKLGRYVEALADAQRALAIEEQSVPALNYLGNALSGLCRFEEALTAYDRAIELAPDYAGGPYNRGLVLQLLGRPEEAIAAYDWALAIQPDYPDALFNSALVLGAQGRSDDALSRYMRLLAVQPDYRHVAGYVVNEQAHMCAWEQREQWVTRLNDDIKLGKPVVVPHAYMAVTQSAEAQLACARLQVAHIHPPDPKPRWTGEVYRHDRIRLAYLSADFHEHPVAFLMAGMLEQHDHERFDVTGVVFGLEHASPTRSRVEATFDRVVNARRKTDAEVADLLREMEIDIAVDLMGFTQSARTNILACRPAPVQVNYLGFPATMGAPYMDYIIADRFAIPEASRIHYAENVVYLPGSLQVNDSNRRIADATPSRSDVGLPEAGFVFCSLNNTYKLNPEIFTVWMRILERVPGSVLWMVAGNPAVKANLRREAQARGVAPDRLVFASRKGYEDYLAQYRLADLFLDTLPYNGGATVSDALWAGLPVLTCAGDAFAARLGGSLLNAVGLPELITDSLTEYESLACQLATDAPRLSALRQKLARNRTTYPLFDTGRYRRNIEAAFVTMWEKTQRGEPPGSFDVPG